MRQFLYHFSQILLTLFWVVCILAFIPIFAGIGFAGGMLIGCWEDVRDIKFDDLEYNAVETWQQHLEVYSSVCEVQKADTIEFLLDKLERLEYKKVSEIVPRLGQPGEYAQALDAEKKNGTVRIHLRDFEYPYLDVEAGHVQISVKDGKIVSIRNEVNAVRQNFYLEPEKIADIADRDKGTTRRLIPLLQMPRRLQGAFIAIEDRRFSEHWGVDVIRLAGAFKGRLLDGKRLAGTSTLTQQLARNIYLFEQRSKRDYVRKGREILLAVRIEKVFSKDEILERYLNYVDLGRPRFGGKTLHGVQQAARGYFNKEVSELENHECALLAALPKGPRAFSPFYNPKDAKNRRDIVLSQMLAEHYIAGESEWLTAINAPLLPQNLPGSGMETTRKEAGHFLQYVHDELLRLPELKEKLYSGGLKVYTTIDMSMQSVAEKAVADHLRYMDNKYGGNRLPDYDLNKRNPNEIDRYLQAAFIAFEPKTGHIKAMVGGRDFYIGDGEFNFYNRAVGSARRQPGSAFKPIVFAALLEEPPLVTPATVIVDEEWGIVPFPGQWWAPGNYTRGRFKGKVNVRDILTSSINVPTARVVWETPVGENGIREGINRTVDLAKRMGIKSRLDPKPALSLGASGMTVLELTSAYGIFANGGYRTKPRHIQYILDTTGEVIYPSDNYQVDRTLVLDEKVAYQITSCLENVIKHGTGSRAITMGLTRPAAGKTGTTNDDIDAWFVGYTTDMVVGVWVGFDRKDPRRRNYNQQGAWAALPIWAKFMIDAARGPDKEFPEPEGIVFREIDKKSGLIKRADKCPEENISNEPFIEGQVPTELCNLHR